MFTGFTVTKNITLRAKWTPITYTMSYDLGGGVESARNPRTYTIETNTITLAEPTRAGYAFAGWYDNAEFSGDAVTEIPIGSFGNKQFYAKWTIVFYSINYKLDGGTNAETNPTSYTIETNTITLAEPTRAAYAFAGWYDNADYSGKAITKISRGSHENKTFYAKWEAIYTTSGNTITGLTDYAKENITELLIPSEIDGVRIDSIGDDAFSGCSRLMSINVGEGNKNYKSIDGNLYSKDGKILIQYAIGKKDSSFTIPNSVTSIGDYAFNGCSNLTSIIIPDSVTSIGDSAFSNCSSLNYNKFDNAYYLGNDDNPYVVLIKAINTSIVSCNINEKTKVIGAGAFYYCFSLRSITIPNSVTSIGYRAFYYCQYLTSITIPDSVTSIGGSAFSGCSSLTSVTIPDSVTSIGDMAFSGCESLTSINVGEKNKHYKSINDNLYSKDGKTLIQYAVGKKDGSFTIPDSVTSIGGSAFSRCSSLTSVTIPDTVTSIGNRAFSGCESLTSINVGENNKHYKSIDGNLYSKDGKTLIQYAVGKKDSSFTIPDGVTSIGDSAFSRCSSLTSVTIPDSVTSIGNDAFSLCRNLTSIIIPDSVTSIGDSAFYWCSSLTSIIIPDSVTNIGAVAFCYCYSLTSITIPDSVTSIGNAAFYDCSRLKSITIPNSVTSIGYDAFYYCSRLKSITIPDSVTSIGDNAFSGCKSLTSVTIGNSVTSIGDYAFQDCSSLTSIIIPDSVTSIGDRAFENCTSLTSINIPDSVKSIGDWAFSYCESLTSVTIGNSVTSIGKEAFYYCRSLKIVFFEKIIGWSAGSTSISSTALADPETAAKCLINTYCYYSWQRS